MQLSNILLVAAQFTAVFAAATNGQVKRGTLHSELGPRDTTETCSEKLTESVGCSFSDYGASYCWRRKEDEPDSGLWCKTSGDGGSAAKCARASDCGKDEECTEDYHC